MLLMISVLYLIGSSLASTVVSSPERNGEKWDLDQPLNGVKYERVKAVSEPTPDRPALRFSKIVNIKGQPGAHSAVSALGQVLRSPPSHVQHTYQNVTNAGNFSTQYAIECGWDGIPVWLIVDTGSSDTWAVQNGFKCGDEKGLSHSERACGFGKARIKGFRDGPIDDLHFYLKYGSGERVFGPMGHSDITCGGVSVSEQQVGLANYTYWHGNNVTVGILGLAYQSITSAYYGKIGQEAPWNSMTYSPFFTSAITQGSIDPLFSVTLMKNSSAGMIAWGGLPPVEWQSGSSATTDLIVANLVAQTETSWRYSFYTIIPDGVRWGQTTDKTKYPYIVDTGTTMNYLPPPLAEQIAAAFQPRAVYLYQWGAYFAPCDAIPPRFAVIIQGMEFWINSRDMIYQDLVDPMTGYCAIAIASGGPGPYILGDVFLQNVIAVFDVGGAQMRFYARA